MDAALLTQSTSCGLSMRDIEIFEDGSGGACLLEIISAPFSASIRFFFDVRPWQQFTHNLSIIDRTLSGEAKLCQDYENQYVLLRGNGRGHINVSGLLSDSTEHMQRLEFSFVTDQTSLGPFITGLRAVINPNGT